MFGLSRNQQIVSEDSWVAESVVVGRVDGGNDADSTSYSGTESGFFLSYVGITGLEALASLFLFCGGW